MLKDYESYDGSSVRERERWRVRERDRVREREREREGYHDRKR